MSNLKKLLVICLFSCSSALILLAGPGGDAMRLVGTWELVGIGDATGNVATPERLLISLSASGDCSVRVWEPGELHPDESLCKFVLTEGLLELTPLPSGTPKLFRITWDAWELLLEPLDGSTHQPPPLRFEKRAW